MVNIGARWKWSIAAVALLGLATATYFLKPVTGPPRNLALAGDAARGAYIIRLAGCGSCHTDHENSGAALSGGKPLTTPFGTFYPPNITPDKQTGIGNWTLAQFSDALSNGNSPRGNLYPVFPYNDLTLMSDQDVVDLYAAVMATPAIAHTTLPNRVIFPFNIRLLVSGWKNLFFSPHRYHDDPSHSASWNRGAYLANGLTHCVACHSPLNALGAVTSGKRFTGNSGGGPGGKAPPLTVLALLQDGYTRDSFAETLKTGLTPNAGKVGGEMGLVISDETSHWTDDDRKAVADYLLNLK
ncbi:c-type cytochrome [Mesorhizobium sp. INR15]|uniref:c-type cytochrome n=1 Tax=Mesorhizobium sp. INR15 TaxID=2654248 RepID=UPI0018967E62|nr:cytochrome c [Mesorhizobium sp. INR15]QPC95667.1 cytochrome C [Mesorhizobium sp. INR15]